MMRLCLWRRPIWWNEFHLSTGFWLARPSRARDGGRFRRLDSAKLLNRSVEFCARAPVGLFRAASHDAKTYLRRHLWMTFSFPLVSCWLNATLGGYRGWSVSTGFRARNAWVCVHIEPLFSHRHAAHPTSVLVLHPREIRALWPRAYRAEIRNTSQLLYVHWSI